MNKYERRSIMIYATCDEYYELMSCMRKLEALSKSTSKCVTRKRFLQLKKACDTQLSKESKRGGINEKNTR